MYKKYHFTEDLLQSCKSRCHFTVVRLYITMSLDQENIDSTSIVLKSRVEGLDHTAILTDNFTLFDVLQKLKDQVREIATRVSQLDRYLNLIKNPVTSATYSEVLKAKRNIINDITHLLKETKPLDYPSFQSLCSVKLLKTYENISSECKLLLNNIKHNNNDTDKHINRFNNLTQLIKDFQKEIDNEITQNNITTEVENEISKEFRECKSDMYTLLSQVDPTSTLKEILSLLVECNNEGDEDSWVNIEDMPHLVPQCHKLKKNGLILQNEQNKYLFKLNV